MKHPVSGIVPDRGIKVSALRRGVSGESLFVWVPTAEELAALEQRHQVEFGTSTVTLNELSEALVR